MAQVCAVSPWPRLSCKHLWEAAPSAQTNAPASLLTCSPRFVCHPKPTDCSQLTAGLVQSVQHQDLCQVPRTNLWNRLRSAPWLPDDGRGALYDVRWFPNLRRQRFQSAVQRSHHWVWKSECILLFSDLIYLFLLSAFSICRAWRHERGCCLKSMRCWIATFPQSMKTPGWPYAFWKKFPKKAKGRSTTRKSAIRHSNCYLPVSYRYWKHGTKQRRGESIVND